MFFLYKAFVYVVYILEIFDKLLYWIIAKNTNKHKANMKTKKILLNKII